MPSSARRDLGFDRIGRTTRFLTVGAIVAGGILSAAVAKSLPGKTTHSTTSPAAGTGPLYGSGPASTLAPPVQPDPSLNPPARAPQASTSPPVVSSGGS
jgi:hypothetical protein